MCMSFIKKYRFNLFSRRRGRRVVVVDDDDDDHHHYHHLALGHSGNFAKVGSLGVARNSKQFAILKQHPAVCLRNFRRSYAPSIIARFVEGIAKYSYPFIFLKLIMDADVCAKLVIFKQQIFQCLQQFKKCKTS